MHIIPLWATIVEGTIHNQFALDEYFGTILRVVTTRQSFPKSVSIYTFNFYFSLLAEKNNVLPGQIVTSTRYVGRKLFCGTGQGQFFAVTFIPNHFFINVYPNINLDGQIRYLHPLNQNYMLGFGRGPLGNGLRVWVLSISSPFPQQVGIFPLNNQFATSNLEYDHRAFMIYPQYFLVVIPLRNAFTFNGALILRLNPGFTWTFTPKVIHHYVPPDTQPIFGDRTVDRSAYINEYVYTKSKCLLKVKKISDILNNIGIEYSLPLPCAWW